MKTELFGNWGGRVLTHQQVAMLRSDWLTPKLDQAAKTRPASPYKRKKFLCHFSSFLSHFKTTGDIVTILGTHIASELF